MLERPFAGLLCATLLAWATCARANEVEAVLRALAVPEHAPPVDARISNAIRPDLAARRMVGIPEDAPMVRAPRSHLAAIADVRWENQHMGFFASGARIRAGTDGIKDNALGPILQIRLEFPCHQYDCNRPDMPTLENILAQNGHQWTRIPTACDQEKTLRLGLYRFKQPGHHPVYVGHLERTADVIENYPEESRLEYRFSFEPEEPLNDVGDSGCMPMGK